MIKIFLYQNAVRADIFLWLFGSFVRSRALPRQRRAGVQIKLIIGGILV